MKIFLLDLWHDLREKRLAPVAVVLALGLVAVPVLLAKPAEKPAAAPVASASKKADNEALAALTKVKLGDDEVGRGSTLGVFDPDNPFKPPKGAIKKDTLPSGAAGPGDTGSPVGGTVVPDTGSDSSPLLIFMGVTANGGNAVFLVDSTLEAAGEGSCKPSESHCAFAYIGAG